MKWLIGIVATTACVFTTTGCVSPTQQTPVFKAQAAVNIATTSEGSHSAPLKVAKKQDFLETAVRFVEAQKIVEAKLALQAIRDKNSAKIAKTLKSLKKHVGKTWYVFSGTTPSGWDCSGLVLWTYAQMNVELEHRASKQTNAGVRTKHPKPGDIVSFMYKGSKSAYHVGIYIGNGKMVHAPKKGHLTRIDNAYSYAKNNNSKVVFTRVLDN
jgi:cell wall-associated NlpC family hydrolase